MKIEGSTVFMIIAVLVLSAFFKTAYTAFGALSRSRVKTLSERGNRRASLVLKLTENENRTLLGLTIGLVLTRTAFIAPVLFITARMTDGMWPAALAASVSAVALIILGEVLPAVIAGGSPERVAVSSARTTAFFLAVLTPLTRAAELLERLFSRIFKRGDERRVSDEELLTLVEEAALGSGIGDEERELLYNAVNFSERVVGEILTPRISIDAVESDVTAKELERVFQESGHSRIPVYEDSLDNIKGVVNLKDFYRSGSDADFDVGKIMTEPVYVSETMKIGALLKFMQKNKAQIAVAADEYGGTLGIVTMEDILEELVGEIWDEHDEVYEEFSVLGESRCRVLCAAGLDKLFAFFKINGEGDSESVSVGGWVMEELGHVPGEGDSFEYKNLRVIVTKVDRRRALEIEVEAI